MSIHKSAIKVGFGHVIYIIHISICEVSVNTIMTIAQNGILNLRVFQLYELLKNFRLCTDLIKAWVFSYHTRDFFLFMRELFKHFPSSVLLSLTRFLLHHVINSCLSFAHFSLLISLLLYGIKPSNFQILAGIISCFEFSAVRALCSYFHWPRCVSIECKQTERQNRLGFLLHLPDLQSGT